MINPPKTREEAAQIRYESWAGNPKGSPYNGWRCAYEIPQGYRFCQCSRGPGHGSDALYCKQHAKKVTL